MQGLWNLLGKSGQGPGKDFQYDIGEKISSIFDSKSVWNLCHGKKRSNGDLVSVFICDGKESSPEEFHLAKTACKRLRTLRHPNIIKFIDSFENENLVYVVTEPVTPLFDSLEDDDGQNNNLITWGLHQVVTGLSFLINNGNLQHENVNIFSVFVGLDGEWKLGGVEYVHAIDTDCVAKQPYLLCYDPPDTKLKQKQKWSNDAWGLGCLIWEIYNGSLNSASDLKNLKKIPKPLISYYCELVSANPKSRTNPKAFLEKVSQPGEFLFNDFINANLFLQEIQIKDVNEQKAFFQSLDKTLDAFPKQFCVHKVLPQLLNAFEYGTAGSSVLSPLFKVGLLLDDTAYQSKIIPCVIKLFSSNDRATRIQLLQQMEKFVKHLQPSVVDNQIFPCVATGFGDTLPAMREQTVKSMLLLTPKLSEKTINNNLLRYFAKLQMDEQPGIRTNTTVCLGRIATHFSPATRQKVLIPAFTRALRDPFPPARNAGIAAITACQEFFANVEIACKVLPSLCALTVDPDKSVRDNVFRVIKAIVKKLEENSNNPQSALNNKEVAEKEMQAQSGWTGWAVTSLTSRFYQNQQMSSEEGKKAQQQPSPSEGHADKDSQETVPHKPSPSTSLPGKQTNKPVNDFDSWNDDRTNDNGVNQQQDREEKDHDSDSDYGDDWGWDDKKETTTQSKQNQENDWNIDDVADNWGNEFDIDESFNIKPNSKAGKQKSTKHKEEKSVADMLGMTGTDEFLSTGSADNNSFGGWEDDGGWNDTFDVTQDDGLRKNISNTNEKERSNSSKHSTRDSNQWEEDDGWGVSNDSWTASETSVVDNNDDDDKEKRKMELQKKREQRRLQREQQNKEKRTSKQSGAMKLGAVKKK